MSSEISPLIWDPKRNLDLLQRKLERTSSAARRKWDFKQLHNACRSIKYHLAFCLLEYASDNDATSIAQTLKNYQDILSNPNADKQELSFAHQALGFAYSLGLGVNQDIQQALQHYKQALQYPGANNVWTVSELWYQLQNHYEEANRFISIEKLLEHCKEIVQLAESTPQNDAIKIFALTIMAEIYESPLFKDQNLFLSSSLYCGVLQFDFDDNCWMDTLWARTSAIPWVLSAASKIKESIPGINDHLMKLILECTFDSPFENSTGSQPCGQIIDSRPKQVNPHAREPRNKEIYLGLQKVKCSIQRKPDKQPNQDTKDQKEKKETTDSAKYFHPFHTRLREIESAAASNSLSLQLWTLAKQSAAPFLDSAVKVSDASKTIDITTSRK